MLDMGHDGQVLFLGKTMSWCITLMAVILALSATTAKGRHLCDRRCVKGAAPKICSYNFTIEQYRVLSTACYKCPRNITDCKRQQCIAADGVSKIIVVANRLLPGPTIAVCEGDTIDVNMINVPGNLASTIHWHGVDQKETPYMDGVPFVTQCPVLGFNNFRYTFKADRAGTQFWHSHIGFQRTDGFVGPLIIRRPLIDEPNRRLYNFDRTKDYIMITDWINMTGEHMYFNMYRSSEFYGNYLNTILVNGKGRVERSNRIRHQTPLSEFRVQRGSRYRFRMCNAASFMCPVQVSIDRHRLTVIGSDSDDVQPFTVDSIALGPGERFDFVLNATQSVANYWIKVRGLALCNETFGLAILRYDGAPEATPNGPRPTLTSVDRSGLLLNPINLRGDPQSVTLLKLVSLRPPDPALKQYADRQIYLPFDLCPIGNPAFYDSVLYPYDDLPPAFQHLSPMLNEIVYEPPPSPLLSQYGDIPQSRLCNRQTINKNCTSQFCSCTHLIKVELNSVVELILIDTAVTGDDNSHPFHLHGHNFRVVAIGNESHTVEGVRELDQQGRIKRNLQSPIAKDTVTVPIAGYVILRFYANNPGFWMFHCHIELHSEGGMSLVFQVGNLADMVPVPPNFPRCGHFKLKKS